MTLTRYTYKGPPSAASLRVGEKAELLDVRLQPGKPCELPAEHEYTQVLLALGHLEPAPTDVATGSVAKKGGKA